jgi:fibronectin-binding autotransporter adhesin
MGSKRSTSVRFAIFTASLVGIGASVGHATPLIFEDFNPPGNGGDLAGTPAGTGLTGNWFNTSTPGLQYYSSGNNPDVIIRTAGEANNGTTLVYPTNSSLPAPAGGTAEKVNGGYPNDFYQATMATPIPLSGASGTYYFSYLLDNGNGVDYAAQLNFGGASTQIYAGFGYGSKDDISVEPNNTLPFGGGNSYNTGGGSFAQGFSGGNLGLVVGELVTTASGADTINVKLFRYQAGGPAAALPVNASGLTWDASYSTNSQDTLTQLGIFQAGVSTPEMDAIRVGTAYADVVGTVTPVSLSGSYTTYTGAVNGSFDTSTMNFSFNGSSVAFQNGNSVLFDDTATGTHNIVVAAGGVSPSVVTFNNTTATAPYNFSGDSITSAGMLTLVGSGTVSLGNLNTFLGGVNLSNGSLVLSAGGTLSTTVFAVGSGSLNFNGGTLQAANSSASFLTGTVLNVMAGGGTIDTQGYNVYIGEALSASASSPGGGITKIGTGTLTLGGHSTYTGGTNVNAGTVVLATGGGAGAVQGPLTINAGGTVNASSTDAIGYTSGFAVTTLTVNTGGTFILGAGNEGYITNLVMAGGTVLATAGGSFNFNTGYNLSSAAGSTTGTISSDIAIRGSSLNITTAAGTTPSGVDLNIGGQLLGGGAAVLYTYGPGTLSLSGAGTYGGGTVINGGTVVVANAAAFGPTVDNVGVSLNGGAKLVLGSLSAPSAALSIPEDLTFSGGGNLQLAPTPNYSSGGVNSVTVNDGSTVAITIGSNASAGVTHGLLSTQAVYFASSSAGSLDVGKNDLDIARQPVSTVTAAVAGGYNFGKWNGPGIVSSAAAQNSAHLTALGVIANDNGSGTPLYGSGGVISQTFDGASPADSDTLVKYTYYGDANLDGKVDGSDYSRIDAAYAADLAYLTANPGGTSFPYTGWYNGDFNYDGSVDGTDYALIDNAFNNQGAPVSSSAVVADSTAQVAGTAAVPEPAVSGIAAMTAAALIRRRRGR